MIYLDTQSRPERARFNPVAAAIAVGALSVLYGLLVVMAPPTPRLQAVAPPVLKIVYVTPALIGPAGTAPLEGVSPPGGTGERTGLDPSVEAAPQKAERASPAVAARVVTAPGSAASGPVARAVPSSARSTASPASRTTESGPVAAPMSTPRAVAMAEPALVRAAPSAPVVTEPAEQGAPVPAVSAPAPAALREIERQAAPEGESRPPRVVRQVVLSYPPMARSQGVKGTVVVQVTVGLDGSVEGVEVVKTPSPLLNQAAQEAARKMKFEPALSNGEPVRARLSVPFNFGLK